MQRTKSWKVYKPRKVEVEQNVFDGFTGPMHILSTADNGDCGADSIASVVGVERSDSNFQKMREYCRKYNPAHDIHQEFDPNDDNHFWLETEDIVIICLLLYKVFPIIYNGLWNPVPKIYKKERTVAQMRSQQHGTDQTNFLVCPFFLHQTNFYKFPSQGTKFVIIKMIKERHYQPMGVLIGNKIQTQFNRKDLPDFWLSRLQHGCFEPITEFRIESGLIDEKEMKFAKSRSRSIERISKSRSPSIERISKSRSKSIERKTKSKSEKHIFNATVFAEKIRKLKISDNLILQANWLSELMSGELNVSQDLILANEKWAKETIRNLIGQAQLYSSTATKLEKAMNTISLLD